MDKSQRKVARAGLSMLDAVVVVLVIAVITAYVVHVLAVQREEGRRIRCRNNLNRLGRGIATYIGEYVHVGYPCPLGRGQRAGTYNGAEWLASLYWTGVVPDPCVFLCPSSGDTNADGKDIGCKRSNDIGGSFSTQTVSYAGLWWKSVNTQSGNQIDESFLLPDFPPSREPMACDDTQGTINHGDAANGGMSVLFFDSHVEFWTAGKVDITSATGSVGKKPGPLWRLKN